MWVGSMTLEYMSIRFHGRRLQQTRGDSFNVHIHIHACCEVGNLGGVIPPTLCAWLAVDPKNLRKMHCFYPDMVPLIVTNNGIVIENTDVVHNVLAMQTGTVRYSYRC
jgi:hypothetical protein